MKFKRLILILSIATIVVGVLVYSRYIILEKATDWKTYVNERYGFSIRFPQDWELEHIGPTFQFPNVRCSPDIETCVTFTNPKALKNFAFDRSLDKREYKLEIMISENKKNLSLKDWANQEISHFYPANLCQKRYSYFTTVNNLPAIKVKKICKPVWGAPEAPCFINIYFIKSNNLFSLRYVGGDFNAENIFNAMIKSLRWNIK